MLLLAALSIAAAQPTAVPYSVPPGPTAAYITAGQDEPGYRNWYMASPGHAIGVTNFNLYLVTYGVGGIVPTWQLLRTATAWQRCGAQPFEIPPATEWPNVVQTLRYMRDYVIPAVGPVEPVSAYRNPALNVCAGGAPESAHKHYSAIDLVPLRPTTREDLMRTLCEVHARRGPRLWRWPRLLCLPSLPRRHHQVPPLGGRSGLRRLPADHPCGGLWDGLSAAGATARSCRDSTSAGHGSTSAG